MASSARRAGRAGAQAWASADTQQHSPRSGKVLPAPLCCILPFPPCAYFCSDISGRGIRREGKGSAHRSGAGQPFPERLSGDADQTHDLGEALTLPFPRHSLSKHSAGYEITATRRWVLVRASPERERCACCYTPSTHTRHRRAAQVFPWGEHGQRWLLPQRERRCCSLVLPRRVKVRDGDWQPSSAGMQGLSTSASTESRP